MPRGKTGHGGPRGPYEKPYSGDQISPIEAERHRRGLTQDAAAKLLGIHRAQLSGYETGKRAIPPPWGQHEPIRRKLEQFLAPGPFDITSRPLNRAAALKIAIENPWTVEVADDH